MLFDGTVVEAGVTTDEYYARYEKRRDSIINNKSKIREKVLRIFKR